MSMEVTCTTPWRTTSSSRAISLTDGGVVAFDDFANVGHPGVAAAVWPAVMERDLEPFVCSPSKLYATRGSDWAARYRDAVGSSRRRAATSPR